MANRNQRATRNSAVNKAFVPGGVVSNFTGGQNTPVDNPTEAPKPVPNPLPVPAPSQVISWKNRSKIFCKVLFNQFR